MLRHGLLGPNFFVLVIKEENVFPHSEDVRILVNERVVLKLLIEDFPKELVRKATVCACVNVSYLMK